MSHLSAAEVDAIAAKVERFVRDVVAPYERDPRCGAHGPSEELVLELRALARKAGVMTPHILPDGRHLTRSTRNSSRPTGPAKNVRTRQGTRAACGIPRRPASSASQAPTQRSKAR